MTNQSNIERVVMRRVHIIRILDRVFSLTTLSAGVFTLALWSIGREVWVERVFANGPQDILGHTRYLVYAFEHTRFLVQALSALTLASVVYLVREFARTVVRTTASVFA